jgi:adenylate cyclase
VTVLFTDIQDFTAISETLEPQTLMDWLNNYLESMTQIVIEHGGIINKYIGDSVMAIFGAPIPRTSEEEFTKDAVQAVLCALEMSRKLNQLNELWHSQQLPTIKMRIGIYTGPSISGSIGSTERLEYTVIGDTVNTASRLESFRKDYLKSETNDCRILVGEPTFKCLDERFRTVYVGEKELKGKKDKISIYQVLDLNGDTGKEE